MVPIAKIRELLGGAGLFAAPRVTEAVFYDPVRYLASISKGEGDLLLSGGDDPEGKGRYSYAAARPLFICRMKGEQGMIIAGFNRHPFAGSPPDVIAALDALFGEYQKPEKDGRVFNGGLVWLFSYEMNRFYEPRLAGTPAPESGDFWCAFYPAVRVFDHKEKKAWDIVWRETAPPRIGCAVEEVAHLGHFECDEGFEGFAAKISKIKRYIEQGDVYQVNLSRRLVAEFHGSGLLLYSRLVRLAPSAMGAYIDGRGFKLLSVSPELFFSVRGGVIETAPIKGTAPRHADPALDAAAREALPASVKDRAENLMIVDLMRNDLSKVCAPGSVTVPEMFRVETLPNVHHLVSTVRGALRDGVRLPRLLAALWPGGSVTGAPKVRAMEIIAELETTPRGFYCGSVAACGMNGGIAASLLIRTLYCADGVGVFRTGGGIVADSDPAAEYAETEHKARIITGLARE
ncbi:MAG: aminodeoxychorismate synthase component I [Nitrospinae bacterium]|nr:aminodeoxychorismate synthase component I [Nitrospinota bacterium]